MAETIIEEEVKEEEIEEVVEKKATPKQKGVKKVGKSLAKNKMFVVSLDNTIEQVLALQEEGYTLTFDPDMLPEFNEEETRELSHTNKRNYFIAEGIKKEKEKEVTRDAKSEYSKDLKSYMLSPISGGASKRLELRKRVGWHQAWKDPRLLQDALDSGYVRIREPDKAQKAGDKKYVPGEENGEFKMIGAREEPELVAVELPEAVFQRHQLAVSYNSKARYNESKEAFIERAARDGITAKDLEKG